ncbi:LysE family translocator [Neomesorhizobium albiziae]|uniref:LysE family translocator n=1 Tax=Neomesorhizobium albiziae TaxID=335020 RepID=UPI001FCE3B3C|nr:LysE family translocator [Mesorhizobium albiziae]
MNPTMWMAFLGTVALMQLPPGPDSMLVMARGVGQGRRVALFTVLGMTVGAGMIQLPLLTLGISSLVKASPFAFKLLQWAGAGHLIWLGLKLVLFSSVSSGPSQHETAGPFAAAREGMIANLVNPWPITFMVAFLPQFVDPAAGSVTLQMLLLGANRKMTGVVVLGTYAIGSGAIGTWMMRRPSFMLWRQRVAGCFIIGLGIRMAITGGMSR